MHEGNEVETEDGGDRAAFRPGETDPSRKAGSSSETGSLSGRRRIPHRSATDSYVAGVAGGIAEAFGVDPFILRSAFLAATLFTTYAAGWAPVVPLAYVILWLALPSGDGPALLRRLTARSARREVLACVLSFVLVALLLSRPVFGIALALAGLAWVLLSGDDGEQLRSRDVGSQSSRQRSWQSPVTQATEAAATGSVDGGADGEAAENVSGTTQPDRSLWGRSRRFERGENLVSNFVRSDRRPRRTPALWPLTLALLTITLVAGFMIDSISDSALDPGIIVNVSLIIIGGVIMLSAWRGRALWTALIAVLLMPAWIGFSVADIGRFDGAGAVTHIPTEVPESGALKYEHGYGRIAINTLFLPLDSGDNVPVHVDVTAGEVVVLAPSDADVVVHSRVGFGMSTLSGYGVGFYEFDREPYVDRSIVRRYEAQGVGCVDDYWSTWRTLMRRHALHGIDLSDLDSEDPADVDEVVERIVEAGLAAPVPIDDQNLYDPVWHEPIFDQDGNVVPYQGDGALEREPLYLDLAPEEFQDPPGFQAPASRDDLTSTGRRTWSYSADPEGLPCVPQPPPEDPAMIEIFATIGLGKLHVKRIES